MNPYTVLNVPLHASEEEIKAAYRQLVKQYHPDINTSDAAKVLIVRINEAYDILSDPERRARYDRGITMEYEYTNRTDPREEHRREFFLRKQREAKEYAAEIENDRKKKFRFARILSAFILLFAAILLVDPYLPTRHYEEVADSGWQRSVSHSRRSRSSPELFTYMHTAHFLLEVPAAAWIDYDFREKPGLIKIEATYLLRIPRTVIVPTPERVYRFEAGTVYTNVFKIHYLLFASALFTVVRRKLNDINYSLCWMPLLLLGCTIYSMMPY